MGAEKLRRMVDILAAAADPEQIVLFGSRARGGAREDSDVDLLVVESEPFGPGRSRHEEMTRLYLALSGHGVSKDVLACSRADVEFWKDSINHVLARALREGEVLYERPA